MSGSWLLAAMLLLQAEGSSRPNIVLIYADDLGYGDVGCYGATAVRTPNIDRLAREGVRFTDAHCSSATCTPSRFSLLTGEYAFRQQGTGVLPGDAALIIKPGRVTLASMLQQAGYRTGVVGKWHLGLGDQDLDWNGPITPGPNQIGFDDAFIMAATGDRVPCVYVRNGRVVGLDPADPISVSYRTKVGAEPTGKEHPELLKMKPSHGHDQTIVNGISRIGSMTGGKSARWIDEEMADRFTTEALAFIEAAKAKPFFLYLATHDIHVPRAPHPRYVGQTAMGPRGDAIAEFDDTVGKVLTTLDQLGLTQNTLVLLSSDNGPVIDDGYQDQAVEQLGSHRPAGPWRGGKYSLYEAGTRVPTVLRWPARVKPGVSEALWSQVDLLRSLASLVGQSLPADAGPDSTDQLPALLGDAVPGREIMIEQANGLAVRQRHWKYIPPRTGPAVSKNTNTELGNASTPQLYDLAKDPGEKHNLAETMPDKIKELQTILDSQAGPARRR